MALAAPVIAKFKGAPPAETEAVAALSEDAAEPAGDETGSDEMAADETTGDDTAADNTSADDTTADDTTAEATGQQAEPDAEEGAEEAVAAGGAEGAGVDEPSASDKGEKSEPEKKAAPAELFAAAPAQEEKAGDDIEGKIQEAQDLMTNGQKVKGFNQLRRLGKNHRKDIRVLKAWCEAAVQMKGWGEAHRVARQWAAIDKTPESRVQFARMQRAVGKRKGAIDTLNALLTERPGHEEARQMLRALTGTDTQLAQR
jgi:hypothetical protein